METVEECEYCYAVIPFKGCNHNCPDAESPMRAPADQDVKYWIQSLKKLSLEQATEIKQATEIEQAEEIERLLELERAMKTETQEIDRSLLQLEQDMKLETEIDQSLIQLQPTRSGRLSQAQNSRLSILCG